MEREIELEGRGGRPPTYLVRIRTKTAEYEGLLVSTHRDRRIAELLASLGEFVNLAAAADLASGDSFPVIVIRKRAIEAVKILEERA